MRIIKFDFKMDSVMVGMEVEAAEDDLKDFEAKCTNVEYVGLMIEKSSNADNRYMIDFELTSDDSGIKYNFIINHQQFFQGLDPNFTDTFQNGLKQVQQALSQGGSEMFLSGISSEPQQTSAMDWSSKDSESAAIEKQKSSLIATATGASVSGVEANTTDMDTGNVEIKEPEKIMVKEASVTVSSTDKKSSHLSRNRFPAISLRPSRTQLPHSNTQPSSENFQSDSQITPQYSIYISPPEQNKSNEVKRPEPQTQQSQLQQPLQSQAIVQPQQYLMSPPPQQYPFNKGEIKHLEIPTQPLPKPQAPSTPAQIIPQVVKPTVEQKNQLFLKFNYEWDENPQNKEIVRIKFQMTVTQPNDVYHALHLIPALDISTSMNDQNKISLAKQGIAAIVRQTKPRNRVSAITFNHTVKTIKDKPREETLKSLEESKANEIGTDLAGAIATAFDPNSFNDDPSRRVVFLLTDGAHNSAKNANALKDRAAVQKFVAGLTLPYQSKSQVPPRLLMIAIGPQPNLMVFDEINKSQGLPYYQITNPLEIPKVLNQFMENYFSPSVAIDITLLGASHAGTVNLGNTFTKVFEVERSKITGEIDVQIKLNNVLVQQKIRLTAATKAPSNSVNVVAERINEFNAEINDLFTYCRDQNTEIFAIFRQFSVQAGVNWEKFLESAVPQTAALTTFRQHYQRIKQLASLHDKLELELINSTYSEENVQQVMVALDLFENVKKNLIDLRGLRQRWFPITSENSTDGLGKKLYERHVLSAHHSITNADLHMGSIYAPVVCSASSDAGLDFVAIKRPSQEVIWEIDFRLLQAWVCFILKDKDSRYTEQAEQELLAAQALAASYNNYFAFKILNLYSIFPIDSQFILLSKAEDVAKNRALVRFIEAITQHKKFTVMGGSATDEIIKEDQEGLLGSLANFIARDFESPAVKAANPVELSRKTESDSHLPHFTPFKTQEVSSVEKQILSNLLQCLIYAKGGCFAMAKAQLKKTIAIDNQHELTRAFQTLLDQLERKALTNTEMGNGRFSSLVDLISAEISNAANEQGYDPTQDGDDSAVTITCDGAMTRESNSSGLSSGSSDGAMTRQSNSAPSSSSFDGVMIHQSTSNISSSAASIIKSDLEDNKNLNLDDEKNRKCENKNRTTSQSKKGPRCSAFFVTSFVLGSAAIVEYILNSNQTGPTL